MGIPYGEIGDIIAAVVSILAFWLAETKGRIIIATVMILLFVLPSLFPGNTLSLICFLGRMIFAVGCYLYVKWQGSS